MGVTRRCVRSAIMVAVVTLALVVPAAAGAQITSFSVTVGHLQAQGTQVPIQVDFQCNTPGLDLAFVDASLTQVSGHKLALGFASFDVPAVPCDSPFSPFSLASTVTASGAFAYKQGVATVSVGVGVEDPTTGIFTIETFTQTTRLTAK